MLSVSSFLPANAGVAISTAFSTIVAPALKIVIMVYSFAFAPMIFLAPKARDRAAHTLEPSTKLRGPSRKCGAHQPPLGALQRGNDRSGPCVTRTIGSHCSADPSLAGKYAFG